MIKIFLLFVLLSLQFYHVLSFFENMYSSRPTFFPSGRPSESPSDRPSGKPSIFPTYSPTDCDEYFNDPYAIFNNGSDTGYYPFNCTTINTTTLAPETLAPSKSPIMRFNSQVNETFRQTYQGIDLVGMTRSQIKGFEKFMSSLTKFYITSDTGPVTESSCDVTQQVLSDVFRRFLFEIEKDEEIPSKLGRLLQAADDDDENQPNRLELVFDITWTSTDQYLNDTEYVSNLVAFMNSKEGRNLTDLALQNLSLPIDIIGPFVVWVNLEEEIFDIIISSEDVPTWDVLKTTFLFTLATTGFFLVVFELGRRHRVLKFVFDKRRATQPFRTPPPLKKRYFEWLLLSPSRNLSQDKMPLSDHLVQVELPLDSSSLDEDESFSDSGSLSLSTSFNSTIQENKRGNFNLLPTSFNSYIQESNRSIYNRRSKSITAELTIEGTGDSQFRSLDDQFIPATFERDPNNLCSATELEKGTIEKSIFKTKSIVSVESSQSPCRKLQRKRRKKKRKYGIDVELDSKIKNKTDHIAHTSVKTVDTDLVHSLLVQSIGLDAFVMLRFIKFGFHVTFYPFIFACIVLIPIYYTNDYEANTGISNLFATGYFAFTLNRLESGSSKLWICWIYALCYRFFTWYRLWREWELFIPLRFEFLMKGDRGMELELIMPERLQKNSSPLSPSSSAQEEKYGALNVSQTSKIQEDLLLQTANNSNALLEEATPKSANIKGNFFANHDTNNELFTVSRNDRETYLKHNQLKQFRNTCLVEFIPTEYRSNKKLLSFFNQLFPDQIVRVKIFTYNPKLDSYIAKRQKTIEAYEKLFAKHHYAKQRFLNSANTQKIKEPKEPTIKVANDSIWFKKYVEAFPYYLEQIEDLNALADNELDKILKEEQIDDGRTPKDNSLSQQKNILDVGRWVSDAYKTTIQLLSTNRKYASGTAVVEFTNLAAAQSGKTNFMTIVNAPDPREIIWANATVNRSVIDFRKIIATGALLAGTLVWSPLVALITSFTNIDNYKSYLPAGMIPSAGTPIYNFIKGYVPVLVLEVLMAYLPVLLAFIATRLIRMKTETEADHFVLFWNSIYRTVNIFIVIISGPLVAIFQAAINDPELLYRLITKGILYSSQFFFDNVIFEAGTGLFWKFCQLPSVISYFVTRKLMNEEATSSRELKKLDQTSRFNWGDCLAEFLFVFMVAQLFCTTVPILLGVCALFFFLAYKVFLHQALYINSPNYESGGSFMYFLSNASFLMIHISNFTFFGMFALKEVRVQGLSYLFISFVGTILIKKKINAKFIVPSTRIALTNARTNDEKNKAQEELWKRKELKLKKKMLKKDYNNSSKVDENFLGYDDITGNSWYMYQQPKLNKQIWETKPRPYRIDRKKVYK